MKKITWTLSILTMTLGAFLLLSSFGWGDKKAKERTKVNWMTFEEAIAASKEEPKRILVDIYADWCGWCKRMDRDTYGHEDIAEYINDNFYAIKFNAEQREPITIGGETYEYYQQGRRGAHELALALLDGQMGLPSTVFLDRTFSKEQVVPGYLAPRDMDGVLHYFAEGYAAKHIPYAMFERKFKSKIPE